MHLTVYAWRNNMFLNRERGSSTSSTGHPRKMLVARAHLGVQPVAQLLHTPLGILRPTISADCSNHSPVLHRGMPGRHMRLQPSQLQGQSHQP